MPARFGWMADTSPEAFEKLIELRRNMTFDEKLRQFFEMTEMVMRGYQDRVRREYPHASEREIFLRAAALRLGNEIVRKAYGWSPDDETK